MRRDCLSRKYSGSTATFAVSDQYAATRLTAVLRTFEGVERNINVPYSPGLRGYQYMRRLKNEKVMLDVPAAINWRNAAGNVGVVGYSWVVPWLT